MWDHSDFNNIQTVGTIYVMWNQHPKIELGYKGSAYLFKKKQDKDCNEEKRLNWTLK